MKKLPFLFLSFCYIALSLGCSPTISSNALTTDHVSGARSQAAAKAEEIARAKTETDKLVRQTTAKETAKDGRFIAYDNGTVLDTRTNLMWAAKDNGSPINWANAKNYCENYRGGGYSDWRMPTQDELAGLYDRSLPRNNGNRLTKLIELTQCCPWASVTRGSGAAIFHFHVGKGRSWYPQSFEADAYRALPVRTAK